jgi:hypothetical protein
MRKDRADLKTAWIRAHRRSNCALRRVCARTRARVCVRVRVRVYVWVWVCVSGPSGAGNAPCRLPARGGVVPTHSGRAAAVSRAGGCR